MTKTNETTTTTKTEAQLNKLVARLAQQLGVETLEVQRILRQAYSAGYEDAANDIGVAIIECRAFDLADEDEAYACAEQQGGEVLSLDGHLLVVSAEDAKRIEQVGDPETARFIDDQQGGGTRTIAVGN